MLMMRLRTASHTKPHEMKPLLLVLASLFFGWTALAQLPSVVPHAPDLTLSHDGEGRIYFTLSNAPNSNNHEEGFSFYDEAIDDNWLFEGYQIWQVQEPFLPENIFNTDLARIVVEMDLENEVDEQWDFVNWVFDDEVGFCIPTLFYQGDNDGIENTFSFTQDRFSGFGYEIGQVYCFVAGAFASNLSGSVDENCGQIPPDAHNTFLRGLEDPEGNVNVECIWLNLVSVEEQEAPKLQVLGTPDDGQFEVQSSYLTKLELWSLEGRKLETRTLDGQANEISRFQYSQRGVFVLSGVTALGERIQLKVVGV